MTVYLAHSSADLETAQSLQRFLENQRFQVVLETADNGFHPRLASDCVVALWSKNSPFCPHRLAFEQRALDAWADGRLTLVQLDPHFAPVGLRDLPFIDATFETQREAVAWPEVAQRIRSNAAPQPPAAPLPPQAPAPAPAAKKTGWSWFPRFGSRPKPSQGAVAPEPMEAAKAEPEATPTLFVSYARRDSAVVHPICEELTAQGQRIWVDTKEIHAGESWAGEIVRAIKAVNSVAVMCSPAAFESDHVKREVYLADRYKRKILPIFLEEAPVPEDFEYFFASVQWLRLNDTPPDERGKAVASALS